MKIANYSRLLTKVNRNYSLLSAQISLTNRCNEDCIHCFVDKHSTLELNIDQLKDILCQLRELGCVEIKFTGGEVFLRNDFFEIADFTKRKHMGIIIQTNATLINEKSIDYLKKLKPLHIATTLYGVDAKAHDFTTQVPGYFERTIRAIKLLRRNHIPFIVGMIVMRHNFAQLPLMRDMARRERWKMFFDFIITPTNSGSKVPLRYRITDAQIKKAYDLNLLPFMNKKNKKLKCISRQNLCANNIGKSSIFISPQGEVFPHITQRIKIGDLRKDSLHHIWYNSEKLEWLRNLSLSDFECFKCKYLFNCYWNPGLALAEHNDLFKRPKEFCRFTKHISLQGTQ